MTMPNRRPRALRPAPEFLETRQLLTVTKTLTGMDADGDSWTLRLLGPGDLVVQKQPGADGTPAALDSATQIDMISVGGANPLTTRLVGKVTPGPGGDGRVYFNNLMEVGGVALGVAANNGIQTIDMPGFWLGNTTGAAISATNPAPAISVPDGLITLRFGGVDTSFGPQPDATAASASPSNTYAVTLGLPQSGGTSVIVDQVITNSVTGTSSTSTTPTTIRNGALFLVSGRLNLFQANAIQGDKFDTTTGFQGGGGTEVVSVVDSASQITGQIGDIRIGGDATNFSAQTNDKISNFYIGGETQNILVLAPVGARNVSFGKGMDTVQLYAHTLENLYANRGALNSTAIISRSIGRVVFGGDVVNTNILSGYQQDLGSAFSNQQVPDAQPPAQVGGGMTALVAGDVVNSVFTASVDPVDTTFGSDDLLFPHGEITAKIEGTINNATATPDAPEQAFYARNVNLTKGPVVPPNVPEAPFNRPNYHNGQFGITLPTTLRRSGAARSGNGAAVPRGPMAMTGGVNAGAGTANQPTSGT